MDKKTAVLLLADGTVFHGCAIGKTGTTTGEIAFNTGMTGYQEVFTDPSYFGQILVMTAAHIGNYGVHVDESESSSMKVSGLVIKNFSPGFSRPSAYGSLQEMMEKDGVSGISNIDTRSLVRHVRNKGAMNALISSEDISIDELKKRLAATPSMDGLELSSKVSTQKPYYSGNSNAVYRIALMDFGVKRNIIKCLTDLDCQVNVYPMNTTFKDLTEFKPDGVLLSNGPGDPSAMGQVIENVREIVSSGIPVFGICLGHQILALSQGLETEKMHNGHRGINHPVKNVLSGKGEITSQNHGFVVSKNSLEKNDEVEFTHFHLNDDTVAGLRLKNKMVFSVQYHPEASAGPHDSRYLFQEFIAFVRDYIREKKAVVSTNEKNG